MIPITVAKFSTLILFTLEFNCTSNKNLQNKKCVISIGNLRAVLGTPRSAGFVFNHLMRTKLDQELNCGVGERDSSTFELELGSTAVQYCNFVCYALG